jgi:broad specificity phosphatase PhoE
MNAKRMIQGHTDTPLSEIGVKQAETLGKHLSNEKYTRAFASNLQRAHHTARIILSFSENPVEITVDKRLCERGFGEAEGKHVPDVHEEAKKLGLQFHNYTPAGGETFADVQDRIQDFMSDLCKLVDESEESPENVLIVTHGGWMVALMRFLSLHDKVFNLKHFDEGTALKIPRNTGITKFSIGALKPNNNAKQRVIDFAFINNYQHLNL